MNISADATTIGAAAMFAAISLLAATERPAGLGGIEILVVANIHLMEVRGVFDLLGFAFCRAEREQQHACQK